VLAALVLFAAPAAAGPESPFSRDWAFAVAIQRDGKIVVAGLTHAGGQRGLAVARYLPTGVLDPRFGRGGKFVAPGNGERAAIAVASDGKIVVGGGIGGGLVRLTRHGALDTTFGRAGVVAARPIFAVAIQKDGKILAGAGRLTRYTARGALDASFGRNGGPDISVEDLALQRDGRILVASGAGLERFRADGDVDTDFKNFTPEFGVASVDVRESGAIVAASGGVSSVDESRVDIARLSANGTPDASFGADGVAAARACSTVYDEAVASQRDGKVVVAVNGDSCASFTLLRLDANGRLDRAFGAGGKVMTRFKRQPGTAPSSS
jgi:uncharacterized delta-60 repeat protein